MLSAAIAYSYAQVLMQVVRDSPYEELQVEALKVLALLASTSAAGLLIRGDGMNAHI